MASLEQKKRAAEKIPNYPGRKAAEAVVRPFVTVWARKKSTAIVRGLLGYHAIWSVTPGGRAGIVDRGWMSRSGAYQAEADFRTVFGCSVEDFDPADLPKFLGLYPAKQRESSEA